MKVAICFTGHLRTFIKCKESFEKKILEPMFPIIPDIFCRVYDRNDINSSKYYKTYEIVDMFNFTLKDGSQIKPKLFTIINNDEYQENRINIARNRLNENGYSLDRYLNRDFINLQGMTMNIYELYNQVVDYQIKLNIIYDLFMFTRPDFLYNDPMDITKSYLPYTLNMYYSGSPDPCDEVVIGSKRYIELYVSRYQNMILSIKEHIWIGSASPCPHIILRYCLARYGPPCIDCQNQGIDNIFQIQTSCRHWNWININRANKLLV